MGSKVGVEDSAWPAWRMRLRQGDRGLCGSFSIRESGGGVDPDEGQVGS